MQLGAAQLQQARQGREMRRQQELDRQTAQLDQADRLISSHHDRALKERESNIKALEAQAKLAAMEGRETPESGIPEADARMRKVAAAAQMELAAAQAEFKRKQQLKEQEYGLKGKLETHKAKFPWQRQTRTLEGKTLDREQRDTASKRTYDASVHRTNTWDVGRSSNFHFENVNKTVADIENVARRFADHLDIEFRKKPYQRRTHEAIMGDRERIEQAVIAAKAALRMLPEGADPKPVYDKFMGSLLLDPETVSSQPGNVDVTTDPDADLLGEIKSE
jgi:hypothetical protein